MPTRKTRVKGAAGVRLDRIEQLSASQKVVATHYTLSTLRPNQPRLIADLSSAEAAYDLEVIASLADSVVLRILASQED